jgi:hypothetical protein
LIRSDRSVTRFAIFSVAPAKSHFRLATSIVKALNWRKTTAPKLNVPRKASAMPVKMRAFSRVDRIEQACCDESYPGDSSTRLKRGFANVEFE